MSTYIEFPNGDKVHIYDRFVGGDILWKVIETGHVYLRERTAIKRSILSYRKKVNGTTTPKRKRGKVLHCRGHSFEIVQPTILSVYENGILYHMVVETGKKYRKIDKAMKKAIEYVQRNSK